MVELDGEEYLNVAEATALLGVKPATLYTYVSRGVLRSYRQAVGRQRLYRRADVAALLALRTDAVEAAPQAVYEERVAYTPKGADDDRTLRNVDLPNVETWAGDH